MNTHTKIESTRELPKCPACNGTGIESPQTPDAAQPTDGEILDWLEKNWSVIRYTSPDMSNKNWLVTTYHRDKPREHHRFLTLREAAINAMNSQPK